MAVMTKPCKGIQIFSASDITMAEDRVKANSQKEKAKLKLDNAIEKILSNRKLRTNQ